MQIHLKREALDEYLMSFLHRMPSRGNRRRLREHISR